MYVPKNNSRIVHKNADTKFTILKRFYFHRQRQMNNNCFISSCKIICEISRSCVISKMVYGYIAINNSVLSMYKCTRFVRFIKKKYSSSITDPRTDHSIQ